MDYTALMDERQTLLATNFQPDTWLGNQNNVEHLLDWVTYWRRIPHLCAEDYLDIKLYPYQQIMVDEAVCATRFVAVAARSAAKSFIIGVSACVKATLYPGSMIVVASGTRGQAKNIVTQKIGIELYGMSAMLRAEIDKIVDNNQVCEVRFRNGSTIRVVTASDNARGGRSTYLIIDEARMLDKSLVDRVLEPFAIVRPTPYMMDERYAHIKELIEEPASIYLSSSWFRSHWFMEMAMDTYDNMLKGTDERIIAMDYAVTLRHTIKTERFLSTQKATNDEMTWKIEYCNYAPAENTAAYFTYDMIMKCQKLVNVFYPKRNGKAYKYKTNIPRTEGEIRVLTCDIAMMGGDANDNSVYTCLRLLPESVSTDDVNAFGYRVQLCYMEAPNGMDTLQQTLRIKQLENDFEADYIVLDARSFGISIYDTGARTLYDPERGCEYPPWKCSNNKDIADHVHASGAKENLYAFLGNVKLNNDLAVTTREMMVNGKLELPVNPAVAEETLIHNEEYNTTDNEMDVLYYRHTYMESSLLAEEMANLTYERLEQTGMIRLSEDPSKRKDRYVSLAMGLYFSTQLSRDLDTKHRVDTSKFARPITNLSNFFGI